MKKIAINGLGRIGRLILRHFLIDSQDQIDIVACNDLSPIEDIAYLMKYDSVHGRCPVPIEIREGRINAAGRSIKYFSIKDPAELPWKELGVE